jgi:phosphoribosylamine-glycine ligase
MNKFVVITMWGEGLGIAWQLQRAGKEVIVGVIDDPKTTMNKPDENPEAEKRRHTLGSGVLDVRKAEQLVEEMRGWKDKDEWFVYFDFSNQFKLARKLGEFKYGMFPQRFDYEMENDRDLAKDFVKKNYPLLTTPETQEFKTIEETIDFLNESEEFWALKGNDSGAHTIVPSTKIIEHAREELTFCLTTDRKEYESKGMILERQIRDGVEVCVEAMFWNGEMIATTIDLEQKTIGSGNLSYQVGCANNLICEIPMDCELVNMGVPEAVRKVAQKHRGWFIMDANIILKDDHAYFLEFCVRPGYDSLQTEMEMAGGPAEFFDALIEGENPFKYGYGVGVRGLNLKNDSDGMPKGGIRMAWKAEAEDHVYPFGITKEDGKFIDAAFIPDVVVFTGASDDPEYAAIKAFKVAEEFSYDALYYRPLSDWKNREYPGNIGDRLEGVERLTASPDG